MRRWRRDLRLVVREQLTLGKSDAEMIDYLVTRYGNFVLLKPPVEPATWALWLGPFAVLLVGGAALIAWSRRPAPRGPRCAADGNRACPSRRAVAGRCGALTPACRLRRKPR